MKLVSRKIGLILRLGVLATALLFGQQAMAVGTRADTQVLNTATVDFEVAGVVQDQLSATAEFVVDRRVNFNLTLLGGALVPVTPGGTFPPEDYFFDFELTNTSNSEIDFNVLLTEMVGGTVRPLQDDNADMDSVEYAVSANSYANGDTDPARGGPRYVDELEADDSIRIRVFGDAAAAMTNGQIAGVDLNVIGAVGGTSGTEGLPLANGFGANTALGVENVFADAGNDNSETAQDGFIVVSAELSVVKSFLISNDPLGAGLAIPGVTMEYSIAITNANAVTAATAVSVTDLISPNVAFVFDAYGSGDDVQLVELISGITTVCSADVGDVDNDGCGIFAPGSTLIVGGNGTLSVGVSDTLTISFQVLIPDPLTTPP